MLLFSDTLYSSISEHGTDLRVAFGDFTSHASGVSEWQSFSHNMLVPEPSRSLLLCLSVAVLLMRRRR